MKDLAAFQQQVKKEVDTIFPQLKELKYKIGVNPELGSEEYVSSKLLVETLREHGFQVGYPFHNMETAFKAVYRGQSKGPIIAILSEYDALPGVGHGCGHNIIGTAAIGAGIALSKILKVIPGEVWVIGTPAEEGHGPSGGSKVRMAEGRVFDDVDVAMMIHPHTGPSEVLVKFLATKSITIKFTGKTSHAANDPHEGVNALNAAMLTYMAIHANRQQLRRDRNAVIHGIITEGGLASNIIPDKATLRFGVRSSDDTYIPELVEMVLNSAKGAAIATGCTVETSVSTGLKSNIRNKPLEDLYEKILTDLGEFVKDRTECLVKPPGGSTDYADVSHVVPGIHPMISIADLSVAMHSKEMAKATMTQVGDRGLELGTKSLALASTEILLDHELLKNIKNYFENNRIK